MTQQIQVTVELNPPSAYFSTQGTVAPPVQFDVAYFQVQQTLLNNQGDALARRIDMDTHGYGLPLPSFDQQQVQISLPANAVAGVDIPLTATGFRSGQVRSIQAWLTKGSDTTGATKNISNWYLPTKIEMSYSGQIIHRYYNGVSQLWNLINGRERPAANSVELGAFAGGAYPATDNLMFWAELPFAQPHIQESTTNVLVNGMSITNGILNFTIQVPSTEPDWTLNLVYVYNASLFFTKGSCDYVF